MKSILCALAFLLAGAASAQTLSQLPLPPALIGASRVACVADGFNADSSIYGTCHTVQSGPCSGRGCQPVSYITNYATEWDAVGNPLSATPCSVIRRHFPQADQTIYMAGYNAISCPGVVGNVTGTTVVIHGTTYYYVSTDPLTGNELVNYVNAAGYLVTP